jgi:chorismate dehydratase
MWRGHTGLPWVAAVWAVRPEAVASAAERRQLMADLNGSRERGVAHVEELVAEWTPRIALPQATIREYLTRNIHYALDADCARAIRSFRRLAGAIGVLPPLRDLPFLED